MEQLIKELNKVATKKQAQISQKFFKTGPGEYAEKDVFIGVKVPIIRKIARNHYHLSLPEIQKLLNSKIHEHRFVALVILIEQFRKNKNQQKRIFNFYLKNTCQINNWDLVDVSASHIVGSYLINKDKKILYKLADSECLWERRIAIISTHALIRNNNLKDALALSKKLLTDKDDLINKAVGWTLREVGKKDKKTLLEFLKNNYSLMPRISSSYAMEKLSKTEKEKIKTA